MDKSTYRAITALFMLIFIVLLGAILIMMVRKNPFVILPAENSKIDITNEENQTIEGRGDVRKIGFEYCQNS